MNRISIAIVTTLGLTLFACSPPTAEVQERRPQAVRSAEVRIGPMMQGQTHLAEVVAERRVNVIARVPGTVTSISVQEGASASLGDPLVRVSAPDVAARVARVRSERKRAEREREFVCSTLDTDRALTKSGDLPSIQLERSERACTSASLAVEGAKAGEREASVAKSRSVERAPFDGEVLMHLIDEGQSVMPGSPILQFASRERLLRVKVPMSDLPGILVGGSVSSAIGQGRIHSIGTQAMGPGRVIEILIKMNSTVLLKTGTTLSVTLTTEELLQASAVPRAAIGGDDSSSFLMLIEDNKLRRVSVKSGISENGWTAVSPTLPKGTQVAIGALSSLDPDSPIVVVTP